MRWLGLAIGAAVVMLGVFSLAAQDQFLSMMRSLVTTPFGIYAIAGGRVAIGLVFLLGAQDSRLPKLMRVLGIIVIIVGLSTPAFGVARAIAVLDWWATVGPALRSLESVFAMAAGSFVVYAFAARP